MRIERADHYGMCFGVRDAIAEAERLAQSGRLTVLGELVHNPVVRERLEQMGVEEGQLGEVGSARNQQVMITAHGASDQIREGWRGAGYLVADGTCPLVRHAHEQLRQLVALGYFPVVIGRQGHAEVEGLRGDFADTVVIERLEEVAGLTERERFGVVSQTTQPVEKVVEIVEAIRQRFPRSEVEFRDTVCQPTKNRQRALRKLIESCDTVLVIGGSNSNNTLQLVAAAAAAGRRVFHIERAEDLDEQWFIGTQVVGVTAGTSTLKSTVAEVCGRLESFAGALQ